jgi:2-hydroxychromene-2-carboxylate isomerase
MRFYFDYISPYAYLGWTRVGWLERETGRVVEPVPILFAGLLNHFGQKGPAEIAPKRDYIFKHVLRLAHSFGVPLSPPPAHPFNPLVALRVTSAIEDPKQQRVAIDALFAATWGGGGGVDGVESIRWALAGTGLPVEELIERAQSAEIKARVRRQTDDAVERGVFGVPTIEVWGAGAGEGAGAGAGGGEGELFWGVDSLPHVVGYLLGEDPIPEGFVERWAELPVGADRLARRG